MDDETIRYYDNHAAEFVAGTEKADMECVVRLRDGAVVVEDMKEIDK